MNQMISISIDELDIYKEKFPNSYIVELDGKMIKNWNDYIDYATKLFKLPNLEYGYNQHVDNMSDRDYYLNYSSFLLII